jgi:putative transposase
VGVPPRALKPTHVWRDAFLFDRTDAGQSVKSLIVLDADPRESLALRVERPLGAGEVLETWEWLLMQRGAPAYVRSDNGPEFIAHALHAGLAAAAQETRTVDLEAGHPWENGDAESFLGKVRDEGLNEAVFRRVEAARVVSESWRRAYNQRRPHSALGSQTPAERARGSGWDAVPTVSVETHGTTEAIQGHRLTFCLDQF